MNSLLARQVKKFLPNVDPTLEPWKSFLGAVENAYAELQTDRDHMERTLEVTSEELNEANERLRLESERRLQTLDYSYRQTMELQEGMILCFKREGGDFVHTLCRGQLAQKLGWLSDQVEGASLRVLFSGSDFATAQAAYQRAWSGESSNFEMERNGVTFIALLRPRLVESEVAEVILSCVEITEIKEFERSLRTAKERAEKADRAKSEFLAVMSHEIRTPLNAILGFTELLGETVLDRQQSLWLKTVAASGESLRGLIEDILDFSKIEAGMLELHEHMVHSRELLAGIRELFEAKAAAKGIPLQIEAVETLPAAFLVDGQRLRQILINLVGNALKFTEQGAVTLRASWPGQRTEDGRALLLFEIQDSGIGITDEQRQRLFKPFTQADSSTTRVYGGTGLGLAICKRLVEILGGSIDFESVAGQGTRFYFTIAVDILKPEQGEEQSPEKQTQPAGVRVLVVEDRPANRDLLREVLDRLLCVTDFSENGRDAVDAVVRKEYDLILMDLQMPVMDGFEATRRIRALDTGRSVRPRIVALTASTLAEDHQYCREVGMDAVLTKPLRLKALRDEINLAASESMLP